MSRNNARSKRVANKKKVANRQKNQNRKIGFDPIIDKMYVGKSYTFGEMASFNMGYNENNCPAYVRTGPKDWVYAGSGVYVTVDVAKSMGINIR